jgi:hypothetical protein
MQHRTHAATHLTRAQNADYLDGAGRHDCTAYLPKGDPLAADRSTASILSPEGTLRQLVWHAWRWARSQADTTAMDQQWAEREVAASGSAR